MVPEEDGGARRLPRSWGSQVNCPSCGRPRISRAECPYCGIVYAKFRQATPERLAAGPRASTRNRRSLAAAALVVAAATIITVAVLVIRTRRAEREPLEDAPRAAVLSDEARPSERRERADPESPAPPPPASVPLPIGDSSADARGESGPRPSLPGTPATDPEYCGIYSPDGIVDAPRTPTVSATWYEGASGFRRAADEQALSGAPLLALFYTDWCPHCRRFAAEVIPSPEMRSLGERMVKVKVNAEGSEEDRSLAKQLAVTSYPTLLVLASPGAAPRRVLHWSSPSVFVEACERALPDPARDHLASGIALARGGQAERAAAELRAAASDPRLSAEALDQLGALALGASCFERAAAIYTRILAADAGYGNGRARYLRGLAYHRRGDGARALEDAEEACRLGYGVACAVAERARSAR